MRRIVRFAARTLVWVLVALGALIALFRFVNPPFTPLMVMRLVEGAVQGRLESLDTRSVALAEVSPALLRAVIAAEDANFFQHHGVDWPALQRALSYNAHHGERRLRGAGTITMQCARNVFLWPGRSYLRKTLEIGLAHVLELAWGKRRILEVYLNVIEWGDGIFGIEAAAQRYFATSAAQLDPPSAALLAAVLPDPRRWSVRAPGPYLHSRAALIAARAQRVSLPRL